MSLLPYALARRFLFGLDPETAHELTMASLARTKGTPLSMAYCGARVSDPITLAGLTFPNRVGLVRGSIKTPAVSTAWPPWASALSKSAR